MAAKKLSDGDIADAFQKIAYERSVRSTARQFKVTHRCLIIRLLKQFGQSRYDAAKNRGSTSAMVADAISLLPNRRQNELASWLESNLDSLLEIDAEFAEGHDEKIRLSSPEPFKIDFIENRAPSYIERLF